MYGRWFAAQRIFCLDRNVKPRRRLVVRTRQSECLAHRHLRRKWRPCCNNCVQVGACQLPRYMFSIDMRELFGALLVDYDTLASS